MQNTHGSSHPLVIPTPRLLRFVDGRGKIHEKPMTADDYVRLAERCLIAARESHDDG